MHFLANETAVSWARGLRAALDETSHGPGGVPLPSRTL
jgi:hypothetical protein